MNNSNSKSKHFTINPRERQIHECAKSMRASVILLDDLDKELERRGHRFCRYADNCNIYVGSQRVGERVMASLTRFLREQLKLTVNPEKSAVDRPWNRKFLGFSLESQRECRVRVAPQAVERFKAALRQKFRDHRPPNGTGSSWTENGLQSLHWVNLNQCDNPIQSRKNQGSMDFYVAVNNLHAGTQMLCGFVDCND